MQRNPVPTALPPQRTVMYIQQLEDTSTKKKPDKPTQTKVIPNAKGNDKKIQSLKEKIVKRQLQSQFDTAATVMRKFKETKKKHDDKKITQKTNNAEAQPENEKKKTEVSQKAEPTKNIEEKAPDKTKLKDAQEQKEKQPQSKSHKIKRPPKCPNQTQSLLKRKLRKIKRINNLSKKSLSNHSHKLVQMNKNDY
ncbi:Hypothetical_protein [Hexamita inflata]|uniref:Hypothetical_protein n=1 Tax=Hexamita inflata TaxID=28002 RepID=A0AA86P574_9EUKA|nr:Hypothetical protein HINF_LOCUS19280 [Hexamita inflata]